MNHSIDCSKACRHHEEQLLKRSPILRGRMHERCSKETNTVQCILTKSTRQSESGVSPQYSEQTTLDQHRKHLS
jgi:hypothetical protein